MRGGFTSRHLDILPKESTRKTIAIVGVGAIGSFVALSLARMGYTELTLIDYDIVEEFNMNAQGFMPEHIGKSKADVIAGECEKLTGVRPIVINAPYISGSLGTEIIISSVDSMKVRKQIYEDNKLAALVIDPRMSAEYALLYSVQGGDKDYANTLYSDEDAVQDRCTAKSTVYTSLLLSGLVCKVVKDYSMRKPMTSTVLWDIANNNYTGFSSKGA